MNSFPSDGKRVKSVMGAETILFVGSYQYDENGNMTCRVEKGVAYKQEYNAENRISAIHKMDGDCDTGKAVQSYDFGYDGDGIRTRTTSNGYDESGSPLAAQVTRYYFGGAYETHSDGKVLKYYSFAGQTILRDSAGLHYLLSDHLGSVVVVTDSAGNLESHQRYLPFGQIRQLPNYSTNQLTDYGYTGQRSLDSGMGGLMDYKARFYSPVLGRYIQPDIIVPAPFDPQAFNRYSYVANNPVLYNDPSGRCLPWCAIVAVGVAVAILLSGDSNQADNSASSSTGSNSSGSGSSSGSSNGSATSGNGTIQLIPSAPTYTYYGSSGSNGNNSGTNLTLPSNLIAPPHLLGAGGNSWDFAFVGQPNSDFEKHLVSCESASQGSCLNYISFRPSIAHFDISRINAKNLALDIGGLALSIVGIKSIGNALKLSATGVNLLTIEHSTLSASSAYKSGDAMGLATTGVGLYPPAAVYASSFSVLRDLSDSIYETPLAGPYCTPTTYQCH